MSQTDIDLLNQLAGKHVRCKTPEEAVAMPERAVAQVMNIGDYSDVQKLASQVGDKALREKMSHAQAGQFVQRSWAYRHYRLGLAGVEVLACQLSAAKRTP